MTGWFVEASLFNITLMLPSAAHTFGIGLAQFWARQA
jgi:hypothetical protein